MNRTILNVLLVVMLLTTAGEVAYINWTPGPMNRNGGLRGSDFQVFYMAGWMISHGESQRLYDHDRMLEIQKTLGPVDNEYNPPYFLFYPPMAPLMVSPLARLPYPQALIAWWCIQAACFLATAWLLRKDIDVSPGWRPTVWLALAGFYPVWNTVLFGQLSAVLLLITVLGFLLHRQRRTAWAGLVLSMLAMKPQFFVGALLWLLLRRDWRAVVAMTTGLACQLAAVAAMLGPATLTDYVGNLPVCANISSIFQFSPSFEHGPGVVVQSILTSLGVTMTNSRHMASIFQSLLVVLIGWLLYRVISSVAAQSNDSPADQAKNDRAALLEQTGVVLFMLLLTPHVLTYDLVLLAGPLVNLWSSPRHRSGTVLYLAASIFAIPVYGAIGFSLVPVVLTVILYQLGGKGDKSAL